MTDHALGARPALRLEARWSRADTLALLAITAISMGMRIVRLADPHAFIFDETYYAKDACWYIHPHAKLCHVSSEVTWVHPPLGKWLIAAGIKVFGFDSFGYRIVPAIAGTIAVALLYLLARRLFGSTTGAVLASGLFAFDFMEFVQSRTAMLDIFVAMFVVAAFLFLLLDRDRMIRRAAQMSGNDRPGMWARGWRLAAGVMAGAAFASKWGGALLWIAVLVLTCFWEVSSRRGDGGRGDPLLRTLREESASILLFLVVVPLAVYAACYAGRLSSIDLAYQCSVYAPGTGCNQVAHQPWPLRLWHLQIYMADFHRTLPATHSYESPAWSWLLLKRPVSYYFCPDPGCPRLPKGDYSEVMSFGDPFTWWSGILALVFVAGAWVRGLARSYRGLGPMWRRPEGVILAGFGFAYLPWLFLAGGRQAVFIFYILPALPFLYLALAYAGTRLGRSWKARGAQVAFVVVTIGLFGYFYPLMANVPLPQQQWQQRLLVFDNPQWCKATRTHPTTSVQTSRQGGTTVTSTRTTRTSSGEPPGGWCWI